MKKKFVYLFFVFFLLFLFYPLVQANGNSVYDLNIEGNARYNLGKYQEALDFYDKALSIDPNYSFSWSGKGNALFGLGKYQDALDAYNKSLIIDPNNAYGWIGIGNLLFKDTKYQEALDAYDKALFIDPNNKWAWEAKGDTFLNFGKYQEALDAYNKVLSIDPNDTWAQNRKSSIVSNQQSMLFFISLLFLIVVVGVVVGIGYVYTKSKTRPLAFISYRREGGSETARLIHQDLRRRGIRTFLDVEDLSSGHFDERLLREIEAVPNFIVILTPNCLVRCNVEGDWLRREIEHAIKTDRNIIPVLKDGFVFPQDSMIPSTMSELEKYNWVSYDHKFFTGTMDKIVSFLKK